MAEFRVPKCLSMPVIPGGRIQGIPIQDCLLLSVILNHLSYFSFSMVLRFSFLPVTYRDVQLSVLAGQSFDFCGVAPL